MEITFIEPYMFSRIYYYMIMVFVILAVYQCHTQQVLRPDVEGLNGSFGIFLTIMQRDSLPCKNKVIPLNHSLDESGLIPI